MIDYQLTGIDGNGELIIEVPLTAQKAGVIILDAITDQSIEIVSVRADAELEEEAEHVPPKKVKKSKSGKKGQKICKNCGQPGHIAKTCKNTPATKDSSQTTAPPPGELTEDQYNEVIRLKKEGDMMSMEVAKEMDVPLREVNIALFANSYQHYQKRRLEL